jgi:hypothetical protein
MSFSLTTEQVRRRKKTVTRRNGWWFLKPGDIINAVEKGIGLKKGKKVKRIYQVRIVSTRAEPLYLITNDEVEREGFPNMCKWEFIKMYKKHNKCFSFDTVNRIRFEYIS